MIFFGLTNFKKSFHFGKNIYGYRNIFCLLALFLVPRGSSPKLHYQIVGQKEPLRLIMLINNQWRRVQTYCLLIIDIMKNEHKSCYLQLEEAGREYEEKGWICDYLKHEQTDV